jgi:hypothetical protein
MLWILLVLLALALVALVVDRRLYQARIERECQAMMDQAYPHLRTSTRSAPRPVTAGTTHHYTHHTDTPDARCSGSSSDSGSCDSSSGGGGGE